MVKYLIPLGSLTGDNPGVQRYMEVDTDNPCTSGKTIIFNPYIQQKNTYTL